jgi:hypothetical protein
LSAKEHEFVGASDKAFADEEQAKRRATFRLRAFASGLGAAVIALALLVGLALHYASDAKTREKEARDSSEAAFRALAESRRNQAAALAALSNASRGISPALAAKLALAAWPRNRDDAGINST